MTAIWTLPGELYALDLSKPTTLIHILPLLTLIVPFKMCLNDTSIFYLLNSILFASSWPSLGQAQLLFAGGIKRKGLAWICHLCPWISGSLGFWLQWQWFDWCCPVGCPCRGASLRPGESLPLVKVKTHSAFLQKVFPLKFFSCWYQTFARGNPLHC